MRSAILIAVLLCVAACAGKTAGKSPAGSGKILISYEITKQDSSRKELHLNVYRSDRYEGPFAKANPKPISVAVGDPGTQRIVYSDRAVEIGRDYFYYLTETTPDGRERKIVPVTRARALLPSGADERKSP